MLMNVFTRFFTVITVISVLSVLPFSKAQAQDAGFSSSQKDEIQAIIKDYLASNPENIVRALQAYQDNQKAAGQKQAGDVVARTLSEYKDDHLYGDSNAPITLVEYSDFECPYCKQFHASAKALVDESEGQVNWIYRHLPLPMHNGAMSKALASECAFEQGGNEAFWKFADAIFEKSVPASQLQSLAKDTSLDEKKFQECLSGEKHKDKVQRDMADAQAAGMTGTPGTVLFNKKTKKFSVLPGAVPLSFLKEEVQKLKD